MRTIRAGPRRVASSATLTFAAGVFLFLVLGSLTFANTPDDSLITLRYAWNLLHHGQLVFNLGERVEGYTSPLHLLVAVAALATPSGVALFKLKLVSMLFGVGALWQTTRLSQRIGLPPWARLAAVLAVAGSWDFVLSASNGLETSLVAFLATGATASLAREDAVDHWRGTAGWTAALALSRPDALFIIVALGVVSVAHQRDASWQRRLRWLIGPAVAIAALLAFRIAYYGAVLPNTYFAKHLSPQAGVAQGLAYVLKSEPLGGWGLGVVTLVLEIWLVIVAVRRFRRTRPAIAYALGVVAAEVLFVLGAGGDWMSGGRFLAPAIPAATVLVFGGVEAFLTPTGGNSAVHPRRRALTVAMVLGVLVAPVGAGYVAPAWALAGGLSDQSLIRAGNYPLSNTWGAAVGLADCLKPGQTVAYSEIGLFGFEHPGLRVIDTSGLTDAEIARHAPTQAKHPWGVADPHWYLPDSTVGRELVNRRPQLIIAFDNYLPLPAGAWILDGSYHRTVITQEPGSHHRLTMYVRRGFVCSAA